MSTGVLLLNAVLTVRAHDANSHKDKGWEMFTDAVISWLDKYTDGTVFLLWGSYAQKKGARINKVGRSVRLDCEGRLQLCDSITQHVELSVFSNFERHVMEISIA
jgi:uracil DNA glycosylase